MNSDNETKVYYHRGSSLLYTLFCVLTAMIGYNINNQSLFWAIVDFIFTPLAWIKWIICQEVTLSIIKHTFAWFFN